MTDYSKDFGPFDGQLWLNCAHQGPLPRVAVEAAHEALRQKQAPHRLAYESFIDVPARLKSALGRLIGSPSEEVILGNSTSYGLNLLVQGLPLEEGDEVLLIDGDFPATVMTWLPLRERGVEVRLLRPETWPPSPAEIESSFGERTRVFCSSWVFSFFGSALDIAAVGRLCRSNDVLFVVNGSQAIGARPLDLTSVAVDALVGCGFKWLCGPYGTGFAWFSPQVLDDFRYRQAYWLAHGSARVPSYELDEDLGAAGLDIFGTANFINFMAWSASVEYLLARGIDAVEVHDDRLVNRLVEGLEGVGYRLVSPRSGPERSTLVVFSHEEESRNVPIHTRLQEKGVHIAERDGLLRISPHLYNSPVEIDHVVTLLEDLA